MKLEQNHPDVNVWQQAGKIVDNLPLDAMSSEDEAIVMMENIPVKAFNVRFYSWRNPLVTTVLVEIDHWYRILYPMGRPGPSPAPRLRSEISNTDAGDKPAPRGLSISLYNPKWIEEMEAVSGAGWTEWFLQPTNEKVDLLEGADWGTSGGHADNA